MYTRVQGHGKTNGWGTDNCPVVSCPVDSWPKNSVSVVSRSVGQSVSRSVGQSVSWSVVSGKLANGQLTSNKVTG